MTLTMKVTLIDKNLNGLCTALKSLSLCRDKHCKMDVLEKCLTAQPIPHLSVLENVWYSILVEGVSVRTRVQLERHRMFTTMERSTRAISMLDAKVVIPKTAKEKWVYERAYIQALENYGTLLEMGESLEDASYVLPLGIETKFTLTGNGRVWFEYLNKRLCKKHVLDEHFRLAYEIFKLLNKDLAGLLKYCIPCNDCKIKCKHSKQWEGIL